MNSIPLATLRTGFRRGLLEFRNLLRSPADSGWYVGGAVIVVVVIWFTRHEEIEGLGLTFPLFFLPGVLAMQLVFTAGFGTATVLSTEREDGTLLRAKSLPNGMAGYVVGLSVRSLLETLLALVIVLVPATILVPAIWGKGALAVLALLGILLLGLLATLPIGFVIGSVFRNPRAVGGWGLLVIIGLVAVSGLFVPITQLPSWLQVVAQIFPLYWLGHGMRAALLPEEMAVLEIGESWRVLEALGVLGVWALLGLLFAPRLLRRMARRESGSAIEQRRQAALQRV